MSPPHCSLSKGVPVATVYSLDSFDLPRIQSLLKPLSQSYARDDRTTLNVPERQASSHESTRQDPLDEAIIGQLSPYKKETLMEVVNEYADVFAANPKAVTPCREPPMRLELSTPTERRTSPPPLYSSAAKDGSSRD